MWRCTDCQWCDYPEELVGHYEADAEIDPVDGRKVVNQFFVPQCPKCNSYNVIDESEVDNGSCSPKTICS